MKSIKSHGNPKPKKLIFVCVWEDNDELWITDHGLYMIGYDIDPYLIPKEVSNIG